MGVLAVDNKCMNIYMQCLQTGRFVLMTYIIDYLILMTCSNS